ncbi:hypothetical protein Tsp_07898 [Trichinella spiralis]|uniref:hypothetical protein n=1 Tax=Trichinella spiralis TaxID=6334 RepID=UPI0001EFB476|nr:hypothetical protein Tsp_07898 [Trichinella spiralis]
MGNNQMGDEFFCEWFLVDLYHFDQPKMVRSIVRLYNNNDDDDDGKKIYLLIVCMLMIMMTFFINFQYFI